MLNKIENELFAITTADKIHLGALEFDQLGVERREHSAKCQTDASIGGTDLSGQHLCVGIARGAQETKADESWLLPLHLPDDDLVGRVRIRLVEHHALVPCTLDD